MQITETSQIVDNYDHIYISPHLDDAVLSCGGAIARHTSRGGRALVVTLCTAAPPPDTIFSEFAQELHDRWQLAPQEVVSARLDEDSQALERLGADIYWAGMSDAIYRMPEVYKSEETLFGTPAPHDPLRRQLGMLLNDLRARAPRAAFYVPLGVGNHVDHQLTYETMVTSGWGRESAFYEDLPYATVAGALEKRVGALQRQFVSSIIDIDATLSRKLGAIASYSSQIGQLFGDDIAMRQEMTAYHELVRPEIGTYGERVWVMA